MQLYKIVTRFYPTNNRSSVELQTNAAYDIHTATRKLTEARADLLAVGSFMFDMWVWPL